MTTPNILTELRKRQVKGTADVPPALDPQDIPLSFPSKARCPRCLGTDSRVRGYSADLTQQFRECNSAICRRRFTVDGQEV